MRTKTRAASAGSAAVLALTLCLLGWAPVSRIAPWCHDRGVIFLRTFWEITAQRGDALDARQLNAEAGAEEDAGAAPLQFDRACRLLVCLERTRE